MAIDWDLWLRVSIHHEFAFLNARLLHYRIHPGQMSKDADTRIACCDLIMGEFLRDHSRAVTPSVLRQVDAYNCVLRGGHFEARDRKRAAGYYVKSVRLSPRQTDAYRGLVRLLLRSAFRRRRSADC